MEIKEVMNPEVFVVQENEQVGHARNLMLSHGISKLVVVDGQGKPVGMVTEKDLTRKLKGNGPKWKSRPIDKISIRRIMSTDPITANPNDEIHIAIELLIKNNIGSIPIVDDDGIAGILTKTDLMKVYTDKLKGKWRVSDLMTSDVITVNENHSIAHVIRTMEDNKIGKIVVIRDNTPVGIITPENISFAYVEDPETGVNVEKIYFIRNSDGKGKRNVRMVSMMTAGDIMQNHLVNISGGEDATIAADKMVENDISGLPVVDGDTLVGVITKTDLIRGIQ
ncbi:CBS domain-containing protein [Methanobacterium spitsbergense]|uniref:CBS domain-containing protein n=1 Tax=Methanobacterium spitsbergense TaxID=2874285 RepID=A0A8T5UW19_9EURY|nr:CBS domain-containing protein [Methanobacterium spitsbergense]MBZ2164859.1 CBS domain-containing protein [Methanobacterium spitsbergense]